MTVLAPGATLGILGGGQLARMLALAAAPLGLATHVYAPESDSPAFPVAGAHTAGSYDDEAALTGFATAVDVVTYEFENVPAGAVAILERLRPVRPNGRALAVSQDRLHEKQFLRDLGLATAPFAPVDDAGGLAAAVALLGRPALLKTRRFGYDGKGQAAVREGTDLAALAPFAGQPCILEAMVPFSREVSVVCARGLDGAFRAYDPGENIHRDGILDTTTVPAAVHPETAAEAIRIAGRIAAALDYVGVLAVELFVVPDPAAPSGERLVVNEIAPRVHNSGHWTLDGAAATSQFEQHVRAVSGWPLGAVRRAGDVVMRNLIGDDVEAWASLLAEDGARLHLYGKAQARPGRKMGHVTWLTAPAANDPSRSRP